MNKFDGIVGLVGVAAGLIGIGYGVAMHTKVAKVSEKLDRSIDELASDMPIDIPQDVVARAVERAVALQVKESVGKATDAVIMDVKNDIHKQVSNAVDAEYSNIKEVVLKEIADEAAKIDAKRVREDVEKYAKKQALEKFDAKLEDISDKFEEKFESYLDACKDNLSVATKVYKSFADAMTPSNGGGAVLRIG